MTLETQYKHYIKQNPECNYTFDEWKELVLKPFIEEAAKQIEKLVDE